MTLFGVDLNAKMDAINDWGKEYWGFILVMVVASYFLTNLLRNIRFSVWRLRNRQTHRLLAAGRPFSAGSARMPRNIGNRREPPFHSAPRMTAESNGSLSEEFVISSREGLYRM